MTKQFLVELGFPELSTEEIDKVGAQAYEGFHAYSGARDALAWGDLTDDARAAWCCSALAVVFSREYEAAPIMIELVHFLAAFIGAGLVLPAWWCVVGLLAGWWPR